MTPRAETADIHLTGSDEKGFILESFLVRADLERAKATIQFHTTLPVHDRRDPSPEIRAAILALAALLQTQA